ncbi:NXPE family member 3-like [Aplochiton taeniatus]
MPIKEEGSRAPTSLPSRYNKTHCFKYSGQKASPEEAEEERVLLDLIAWPRPPAQLANTTLEQTSDPTKSTFIIVPARGDRERYVGDQLEVMIDMYDFHGRHRPHGGDFLVARLHSPTLLAGVAGQVLDHGNGSYSAVFPLLWEGSAQVEVTLIHPYEAILVLQWLTDVHPDRISFTSLFRSGTRTERTECNRCLPPNQQPLCNYTDVRTGEPWFCFKPRALGCDTRVTHVLGRETQNLISKKEEMLFRSGVNLKVFLKALGEISINVLPERNDMANNIMLKFRFHGLPIRHAHVTSASELRYISSELDHMPGGSDTVVIIGVWAHFSISPPELYIRRLRQIRRALVLLLDRAPETVVVIRTGNLGRLDLQQSLRNSDWYAWQMNRLLRAMFKEMDILLVNSWDMVLSSHLPHDLHPPPRIISDMVDHVLSYTCT